jgi:hypothetical protein
MKLAFLRVPKEIALRNLAAVIAIEVLLFLSPDNGTLEGVAVDYWDGVRLRLASGKYLAFALISGIGFALLLHILMIFSTYLSRFVKPPSGRNDADDPENRSLD